MSTLFALRRQAEEFAALVDAPGGSSAPAGPTQPLLAVVHELRRQGRLDAVTARPEFVASLRDRLLAEAGTVLPQPALSPAPRQRRHAGPQRRLAFATSVAVLVAGSAGMAAAAQRALPGEALYPVKRVIEEVHAQTATSPAARGRDLLAQASRRLDEVQALVDSGSGAEAARVPETLAQFREQAREGAGQLLVSYQTTHDATAVATVRGFAARDLRRLEDIAGSAPASLQPGLAEAAATLRSIDLEAEAECPDCTALPAMSVAGLIDASSDGSGGLARTGADAAGLDPTQSFPGPHALVPAGSSVSAASSQQTAGTSQPVVGPASPLASAAAGVSPVQPVDPVTDVPGPLGSATASADPTLPPGTDQPEPTDGSSDTPGDGSSPSDAAGPSDSASPSDGGLETLPPSPSVSTVDDPLP
jgi:hypothetical protein